MFDPVFRWNGDRISRDDGSLWQFFSLFPDRSSEFVYFPFRIRFGGSSFLSHFREVEMMPGILLRQRCYGRKSAFNEV